jgi:predicted PurR-regulated permease PerM
VAVLAALGFLAYALVFTLIQQVVSFSDTVVNFVSVLPSRYATFIQFLEQQGHFPRANIDAAIAQVQTQVTSFAQSAAANALNIVLFVTNAFINILLVVVLSFYFTLDGKRIRDSLVSIAPQRSMPHVLLFEDALNRVVGNYIRGQLTLALIIGVLAGAVCLGTGLGSYALIIGVLAFLFETIPMVGPALASIPAILLSLLLPDAFPRTFWVILWFFVIQMIESNILGPRIVGHAVGLHPVASILALLVGAKLFGAFGALLATPVVAAGWVVVASLYHSARGETPDEILSHRRSPWRVTIRRPTMRLPRKRRTHPLNKETVRPPGEVQHTELLHTTTQTGEPQRLEKGQDDS